MTDRQMARASWRSILLCVCAVFFSALIGTVTTVIHQSTGSIFDISIPWGLALCLIIVVAWFSGLILLGTPRWGVIASGLALLAMVFVLSQTGPGGSVLVPESPLGNIWVVACPLIVVVAMFWPRLPRASARETQSS